MQQREGRGTIYLVREHRHFWQSAPSQPLLITSLADLVAVGVLTTRGIFMAPISPALLAATLRPRRCYPPFRHPAHTGTPAASRSLSTSSPFFTSAAMRAGCPCTVTREPVISTLSFGSIFTS